MLVGEFCLPLHEYIADTPEVLHLELIKPSVDRKDSFEH